MTDTITPTGRFVYPVAELGREMSRALATDGEFAFTLFVPYTDFTVVEQHALALMLNGSDQPEGAVVLDLESGGGVIPGPLDILQQIMDDMKAHKRYVLLHAHGAIADRIERLEKPAIKQNGKSADYLRHDPTKRNRRRAR